MSKTIKFWKGEKITSMTGNNIFVYGANPEFRNGLGAAKTARDFGAKAYGGGRGIVGNTYGLITKNLTAGFFEKETGIIYESTGYRSVSPEMISANIDELYQCALDNPEKKFFIAYKNDGRNLNGYTNKDMWDLFTNNKYIPENIRFHESFRVYLSQTNNLSQAIMKTDNINPNYSSVESNPIHNGIDYNEEIKVDNQPRENFTLFLNSNSPFSQWYPSKFKVKNIEFTSIEQFMMYCKAKLFKDEEVANELLCLNYKSDPLHSTDGGIVDSHPNTVLSKFCAGVVNSDEILKDKELKKEWDYLQKKIKELGYKVKNYDEDTWVKNRVIYIEKGNYEKFNQNKDLQEILINTDNNILNEVIHSEKLSTNDLVINNLERLKEYFIKNNKKKVNRKNKLT